jgi:predicted nucleic acid-binding protein
MPASFFDSNGPLYLVSGDAAKADRADAVLADGGVVSVQVMNEIANVGRRKFGMTMLQLDEFLLEMRQIVRIVPITIEAHELGLWIHERHRLAVFDSVIVASALLADCDTLWSEDMHDGLIVDGRLTIRNPFAGAA